MSRTECDSILRCVAQKHGCSLPELRGERRLPHIVSARREAAHILRGRGLSYPAIGKPEIFAFFDHKMTNAYTESMNSLIRVVNRAGRGYSLDAIRAKVLYGGKKRLTDTDYKQVALSLKIKFPKVLVDRPPKLHKEKRKRA